MFLCQAVPSFNLTDSYPAAIVNNSMVAKLLQSCYNIDATLSLHLVMTQFYQCFTICLEYPFSTCLGFVKFASDHFFSSPTPLQVDGEMRPLITCYWRQFKKTFFPPLSCLCNFLVCWGWLENIVFKISLRFIVLVFAEKSKKTHSQVDKDKL